MIDLERLRLHLDVELDRTWTQTTNLQNGFSGTPNWILQNTDIAERFRLLRSFVDTAILAVDSNRPIAALAILRPALEMTYSDVLSFRFYHVQGEKEYVDAEAAEEALKNDFSALIFETHSFLAMQDSKKPNRISFLRPFLSKSEEDASVEAVPGIRFVRIKDIYQLRLVRRFEHFRTLLHPFNGDEDQISTNRDFYNAELKWTSLLRQLKWAEFMSAEDFERLNLHYIFLSQFVHPMGDPKHRLLDGHRWNSDFQGYLFRLAIRMYGFHLLLTEVETFLGYLDVQPHVIHLERETLSTLLLNPLWQQVRDWLALPGGRITNLDQIEEAQYRKDLEHLTEVVDEVQLGLPGYMRSDERPYLNSNPLHRLGQHLAL